MNPESIREHMVSLIPKGESERKPDINQVQEAIKAGKPFWEIDDRFLNPYSEISEIPVWGLIGNRRAIPRQGVIAFSAKPKQGKSLAIIALLQGIISGKEFGSFKPVGEPPQHVIIFDTEMNKPTLQTRLRSLMKTLGSREGCIHMVPLVGTKKEERKNVINEMTAMFNPDIIVIDQVARMVRDFNDQREAAEFTEWLNTFSATRTVFVVIHQNKGADNELMKGHLGSELAQDAVECYKVKSLKGGLFEVSVTDSRNSCIEDAEKFYFALNEQGGIQDPKAILDAQKRDAFSKWRNHFSRIFDGDEFLKHGELVARLLGRDNLGKSAANEAISNAREAGAIIKGDGHTSPYHLAPL